MCDERSSFFFTVYYVTKGSFLTLLCDEMKVLGCILCDERKGCFAVCCVTKGSFFTVFCVTEGKLFFFFLPVYCMTKGSVLPEVRKNYSGINAYICTGRIGRYKNTSKWKI